MQDFDITSMTLTINYLMINLFESVYSMENLLIKTFEDCLLSFFNLIKSFVACVGSLEQNPIIIQTINPSNQ